MPIWRRMALMSVDRAMTSAPSTRIEPADGSSSRLQQRSSVLFPDPDGPITNTSSCAWTLRSMPCRTSVSPNFLRRPRMSRIGGLSEDISSFPRHARACGHPRLTVYAAKTWMRAFAGMTESLAARRRVRRRIVAGHAGYPVAREYGHGCGAGRRRDAEPLLVHLGHGAVELHALDDDVERVAKRGRILARRRRPHEAGRIEIGQLELRAVLRRP